MDRYEVSSPKTPGVLEQLFGVFTRNSPKELIKQQQELAKYSGERRLTKREVLEFYRAQRQWRRVWVPSTPMITSRTFNFCFKHSQFISASFVIVIINRV